MNLKLYDFDPLTNQGLIRLERYSTFQERNEYIKGNIFKNEKYNSYYTDSDRWLGVKVVGKKNKDEHVKHALDFIANYLLNSKELSTHSLKKRYLQLLHLKSLEGDSFADEMEDELSVLEKSIVYRRPTNSFKISKNFIIVENKEYANFLTQCLKKHRSTIHLESVFDYTEQYCLLETIHSLMKMNETMAEIKENLHRVEVLKSKIRRLEKTIQEEYVNIRENKMAVSSIVFMAKEIKLAKDEVKHIRFSISELYDDYYFLTEHRVNNSAQLLFYNKK